MIVLSVINRYPDIKPGRKDIAKNTPFPSLYIKAVILLIFASLTCLTDSALANMYAARQISAFTLSRKGTGKIMEESPKVYQFLIEAFNGYYTTVPLAWDPTRPNDNAYAEHKPSVDRKYINIRVSPGLSPLDQVASMVYEAMNAQNEKQFAKITEEAHAGSLTKTEFILEILRLEHKSLKKTRAFLSNQESYKDIDLSQTIFYRKMNGTPENFDDFIQYLQQIKRDEYDVFKHYSDFYDFIIPATKQWDKKRKELAAEGDNEAPDEMNKPQ